MNESNNTNFVEENAKGLKVELSKLKSEEEKQAFLLGASWGMIEARKIWNTTRKVDGWSWKNPRLANQKLKEALKFFRKNGYKLEEKTASQLIAENKIRLEM